MSRTFLELKKLFQLFIVAAGQKKMSMYEN